MTTESVTLQLPEAIYRTARQVAEATHQPLDVVLQASLARALPPLDDVSAEQAAHLQELLDTYGQLTVRKAHAYLLLARRGYRVPMQEEPGQSP